MADHKITDFVDQSAIDGLKRLKDEMLSAKDAYIQTATELAKGLKVSVDGLDQLEKLTKQTSDLQRQAAEATRKHSAAFDEQSRILANTTNAISRKLMEQERLNKTMREEYTEQEKVKRLLDHFHDTYENQLRSLASINAQLKFNTKEQKENEKALAMGRISMAQFQAAQVDLIARHRFLTQEKRTLTQIMTAEEKANQSVEGSYVHMSQQLELLKKAYKDLSKEGRGSDYGKELEQSIQSLDAHLKDTAADIGEFQRNVGNYAIAGQNGIVTTESLTAVINQQAVTMKDVADQTKILIEAKGMLDTKDANYGATVEAINAKLAENKQRLTDVSDIMNTQATSVAEAEAQNQRLTEALKNVDLTSGGAQSTIEALNAKIDENNQIIKENSASSQSVKKNLKDLVLEIATLTIQYQALSEEEQKSADGQALADHIRALTEQAGQLKDAIADTNQAITNAASDTRGFDQISAGIQLAIDGFGLATGAAEMLGISQGDLIEIQTKLQAAIAASNAMTSIQNALQKQSALMQGISNIQVKAGAVAVRLKTAAEGKGVVTTKLLTAAQWLFNKACSANPIGLLVVGIMACVAAGAALIKVFSLFDSGSEKRKEKYKEEAKALEDLQKANEAAAARAKARGQSEWEASNMAIDAKKAEMEQAEKAFKAAKDAYDDDEDEYLEALNAKAKATEEYTRTLEDSHNSILAFIRKYGDKQREAEIGALAFKTEQAEAQFNAQYQSLVKYYSKEQEAIRAQIQLYKKLYGSLPDGPLKDAYMNMLDNLESQLAANEAALTAEIEGITSAKNQIITKAQAEEDKKNAEAAKKAAEAQQKYHESVIKEVRKARKMQLDLIEASGERKMAIENDQYNEELNDLQIRLSKLGGKETEMRAAIQAQIEALTKGHERRVSELSAEAEQNRLKSQKDLIQSRLDVVKSGTDEELALLKTKSEIEHESEILSVKKRIASRGLSEEEGQEILANQLTKHKNEVQRITEEFAHKKIETQQAEFAAEAVIADNAYNQELNKLNANYAKELKAAGNNSEKREEATRKHEEAVAKLTENYAQRRARASVESLEQLLKDEDMSAEERQQLEDQLAKAKIEAEKAVTDATIAENQRQVDADTKAFQKRMENVKRWLQVASDGLNAINDLASTIFDAKIERIEAEQEANTEAGEAEQERITELVEKNVITEEEGEARKRAAADRTQKKEEELEKKKQQLKYKQAVWDKANSAAQIGISTALAIMNALQMKPFPVGIAMAAVAGAMGAVQLATVLATPIPKYAKGTKDHPGGLAIVGDGGRQEVVSYGGNMFLTPDTPTLIDIPKGAEVFPDADKLLASNDDLAGAMRNLGDGPQVIVNNDYSDLKREIIFLGYLIKMLTKTQKRMSYSSNHSNFQSSYGL